MLAQGIPSSAEAVAAEAAAYMEHIANLLGDDESLKPKYLPFPMGAESPDILLESFRDGVLLSHIINAIQPGTIQVSKLKTNIDLSQLHAPGTKNYFEVMANLNLCVEGLKKLSRVVVVNFGAEDILNKKEDLVLGMVWQLIRSHLFSEVNIGSHPELLRLIEPGKENLKDLLKLSEELILLRWINFHLQRGNSKRTVTNFGKDLMDGECYITLLRQITPSHVPKDLLDKADQVPMSDAHKRARLILEHAQRLAARRFATARDIVNGHSRLNTGFVATLFNRHIGIHLPTEDQARQIISSKEDADNRAQLAVERARNLEEEIESLKGRMEQQRLEYEADRVNAEAVNRTQHEREIVALKELYKRAATTFESDRSGMEKKLAAALTAIRKDLSTFLAKEFVNECASINLLASSDNDAPISLADEPACLRTLVEKLFELSKEQAVQLHAVQTELDQSKKVNTLISEKVVQFAEKECLQASERKNTADRGKRKGGFGL